MGWTIPRTWISGEVVTKALLDEQVRDNLAFLKINIALETPSGLTINAGEITKTQAHHAIAPEAGIADNLDTINSGLNGDILFLRAVAGNTITLRTGIDNIINPGGSNVAITDSLYAVLIYNGTNWIIIGGSSVADLAAHIIADDHTQYALVDGTRKFTGDVTIEKAATASLIVKATGVGADVWIKADSKDDTAFMLYEDGTFKGYLKWDAGLAKLELYSAGDIVFDIAGDIDANSNKIKNLAVPAANGDAIRATAKITEVLLESATDLKHTQGTDTALGAVGTKNPPIDADKAIYRDSTASDALVTSTWTQVKAFLKTYFDTLYNLYVHPNHSGDVTSVADGATAIASKAVTLAKMDDMATASLIYRKTAGAGAPEVNTVATLKTDLDVLPNALLTERGSIIFRNATVPAELLHGTDGQVLTTKGDGADPIWATASATDPMALIWAIVFGG
jgi:hypothetical protein